MRKIQMFEKRKATPQILKTLYGDIIKEEKS